MPDNQDVEKEEKPESELLKIQREKYEKIIADKNKIITDLLNQSSNENSKKQLGKKDEKDEDEISDEEKEKQAQKKRMERYKKLIF